MPTTASSRSRTVAKRARGDYARSDEGPERDTAEKTHCHEHIEHFVVRDIDDGRILAADIRDRERIVDLDRRSPCRRERSA